MNIGHLLLDPSIKEGSVVEARWTWSYGMYAAKGEVVKLNKRSARVKLLENAGDHFTEGFVVRVELTQTAHNGLFLNA